MHVYALKRLIVFLRRYFIGIESDLIFYVWAKTHFYHYTQFIDVVVRQSQHANERYRYYLQFFSKGSNITKLASIHQLRMLFKLAF